MLGADRTPKTKTETPLYFDASASPASITVHVKNTVDKLQQEAKLGGERVAECLDARR